MWSKSCFQSPSWHDEKEDLKLITETSPDSYLLSHKVQSALQGVRHFDLPVSIVDLNTSRTVGKHQNEKDLTQKNLIDLNKVNLTCVSDDMQLTRLQGWSCLGRCGPPGCSSRLLYRWGCSSGLRPELKVD